MKGFVKKPSGALDCIDRTLLLNPGVRSCGQTLSREFPMSIWLLKQTLRYGSRILPRLAPGVIPARAAVRRSGRRPPIRYARD